MVEWEYTGQWAGWIVEGIAGKSRWNVLGNRTILYALKEMGKSLWGICGGFPN